MGKRKYLLPGNYNSIENELFRVQRVLEAERNKAGDDLQDQLEDYENSMLGAHDVARSFEKMVRLFSRLVGISTCTLRDLEQIKQDHPDIHMISSVRSKDPATYVAEAALLLSEIPTPIVERIVNSIYASHELFNRHCLEVPMSDCYPDYNPETLKY